MSTVPTSSSSSVPFGTATANNPFSTASNNANVLGGMPRSVNIPTNIWQNNLMSNTSWADDAFVGQKFSAQLQAYLIGYVNSLYSNYSVYQ
jgi:hypothetical protein